MITVTMGRKMMKIQKTTRVHKTVTPKLLLTQIHVSPEEPFSPASSDNEYVPSSSSTDTISENEIQGEAQVTNNILQPKKRKIFQIKEKLSKKRTRNEAEWKQNRNSILRQEGKEYVTRNGKTMANKNPRTGLLCKATCIYMRYENFCDIDCAFLFTQYYSLKNNTEEEIYNLYLCFTKRRYQYKSL